MRVLIVLALLGTAFAVPRHVNRIVGGEETSIEEYPYMANMQYNYWFFWLQACGGSLLTRNVVLSAAHCYYGDWPTSWRVVLGSSFASSGGSTHYVSQLIIHERYNMPFLDNDVALVKLSSPAVYSNTVQPARIPALNFLLADGTEISSVGWGALSSGGSSPETLHHVTINIINQELCATRYAYLKSQPGFSSWPDISDGMLCAGILDVGGKDACQGDSGGPLAYDGDIIVGVTSWGYRCADAFYPGVNARVSFYSDWIEANAV